ncbi:uncharacterized protein BDW43DRAFT_267576 [Aspergillus alliaceus]|uniref:uncharacterized protein n=1 Tax=Petromyces alliaceus TaxID=209559 RepID=UPI0012A75A6C|nr:uncharacterized protein BDW43DRAFT_267576 [Aspergillus alliaceus]KAB8236127.1 hypothetical protein BDW43DRAFT_267576 [Aspergillus alliaceus]
MHAVCRMRSLSANMLLCFITAQTRLIWNVCKARKHGQVEILLGRQTDQHGEEALERPHDLRKLCFIWSIYFYYF